ncbi:MAG TPA: hypothetical protein VGB48_05455, partial [Allosphingosinicella sp.]
MPWAKGVSAARGPEFADLGEGQALLRAAVLPLAEAIERYVRDTVDGKRNGGTGGPRPEALKWIEQSDPQQLAYLAARAALTAAVAQSTTATSAAFQLGRAVVDNLRLHEFRAKAPERYAEAVQYTAKGLPRKRAPK